MRLNRSPAPIPKPTDSGPDAVQVDGTFSFIGCMYTYSRGWHGDDSTSIPFTSNTLPLYQPNFQKSTTGAPNLDPSGCRVMLLFAPGRCPLSLEKAK